MLVEQRLDGRPERLIVSTRLVQERRAKLWGKIERDPKQLVESLMGLRRHMRGSSPVVLGSGHVTMAQ